MLALDMFALLPFFAPLLARTGAVRANPENGERLLRRGELVGVFPEGVKGVGKPYKERYKLARFGRGGFVRLALRTGAPIVPCAIVGAEEVHPKIGSMDWVGKPFGLPYLPDHADFSRPRPARRRPAAQQVVDRLRGAGGGREVRPEGRRRSHPRQSALRAGARDRAADDRQPPRPPAVSVVRVIRMPLPAAGWLMGTLLAWACPGVTEPLPPGDLGTIAAVTRGKVTVSVGQPAFAEGAAITVRIANGLASVVYTEDSKTDCSIVILERRDGEAWSRIAGCAVERLPAVVALGPRRARTARIDPKSFHLGVPEGSSKPAFGAGDYRIRFTFRRTPEPLGIEPEAVFSDTFRVER